MTGQRRRLLVAAGVVWIALGAGVLAIVGGAGNFLPSDPAVPTIGFVDAGSRAGEPQTIALEIGPESFAGAEGIELRSGTATREGELLWRVGRTGPSAGTTTGRVVIGEVPDGFEETEALDDPLPSSWHAEVYNRCYVGRGEPPAALAADTVSFEDGSRVTIDAFRAGDIGFSECDDSTVADRAAPFLGLVSIGIGGVLLMISFASWRIEARTAADDL